MNPSFNSFVGKLPFDCLDYGFFNKSNENFFVESLFFGNISDDFEQIFFQKTSLFLYQFRF